MVELKSIERFLSNNSSMDPQTVMGSIQVATLRNKYRPDRMGSRDAYMKWDLIYSGIDTPHRLAPGGVLGVVDRRWLATEINGLKDFKI